MRPISTAYRNRTRSGAFAADDAQESVLPEFDRMADQVANAPQKGSGLGWVFAKKAEPTKGLYLWGGVGRGKSMLMAVV